MLVIDNVILDVVFSLASVITAIGMVDQIPVVFGERNTSQPRYLPITYWAPGRRKVRLPIPEFSQQVNERLEELYRRYFGTQHGRAPMCSPEGLQV
jgi:hypothetical protein